MNAPSLSFISIPVKMSTLSDLSIQILLTRDNSDMNDDNILIRKDLDTNEFVITYTDPNDGNPVKHQTTGLYRQKVLDYLYYLMKNLYIDEDKFDKFQVNVPGMPRMNIGCDKFNEVYYRDHLYELFGFALDNLENVTTLINKPDTLQSRARTALYSGSSLNTPSNVRQHLFFD